MNKLNIETNNNVDLNKVIADLQKEPLFNEIEVSILNLNDCLILKEENENCKKCRSLNSCKNINQGYCTKYIDGNFVSQKCKYQKKIDKELKVSALFNTLYMPDNIKNANLDEFKLSTPERNKAYAKVVNFITNFNGDNLKGLYLYGTFGIGKTYLLACLAKELANKNIKSLLIYFPDLIAELRSAVKEDGTRFTKMLNELKTIDVLMLDDLGSENMTPFIRDEILGPVLNYRMASNKPICISSNLDPDRLLEHFKIDDSPISETKAYRILARLGQICDVTNLGTKRYE